MIFISLSPLASQRHIFTYKRAQGNSSARSSLTAIRSTVARKRRPWLLGVKLIPELNQSGSSIAVYWILSLPQSCQSEKKSHIYCAVQKSNVTWSEKQQSAAINRTRRCLRLFWQFHRSTIPFCTVESLQLFSGIRSAGLKCITAH